MSITLNPQGSVRLVTVTFNSDNKHTLYFNNDTERSNYFNSLTGLTINDYTYIRKDSAIKVAYNIEILRDFNYLYYTNYQDNISEQVYDNNTQRTITKSPLKVYCYIVGREYINENTTKLYIKTDVLMTYMFNILADTTSISYIERQHINKSEDNMSGVKKYLLPESLETGEYLCSANVGNVYLDTDFSSIDWGVITDAGKAEYLNLNYMIVAGCTQSILDTTYTGELNRMYGGIYNGLTYYGFGTAENLSAFIAYLNQSAGIDTLFNLFIVPISIANWTPINRYRTWTQTVIDDSTGAESVESTGFTIKCFKLASTSYKVIKELTCSNWSKFCYTGNLTNGYSPHNYKLYTFPYCYLQMYNGETGVANYHIEQFSDSNAPSFKCIGALSQGTSIMIAPKNYKAKTISTEDGLNGPKFPTCSWNTDSYTNWLTQTAVTRNNTKKWAYEDRAYGTLSSLAKGLSTGISTGAEKGVLSGVVSGVVTAGLGVYEANKTYDRTIESLEAEKYQHSLVPDSINNGSASTEVLFSYGNFGFSAYIYTISGERAKQIDEYFDRFGYKVNKNGNIVQAIKTRSKWNYIRTIECNIKASIPDEALEEIKNIFNNGVTYWKNPSEMYRYDLGGSNN